MLNNIKELEKRWFFYKLGIYIPYAIASVSILLISIIVYILFFTEDMIKKKVDNTQNKPDIIKNLNIVNKEIKKDPIVISQPKPKIKTEPKIEKKVKKTVQEEQTTVIKPSLKFLNKISNQEIKYDIKDDVIKEKIEKLKHKLKKEPQKIDLEKQIKIKRQNSLKDIEDVVKRFNKNNNPLLSLFIAKKYYKLKNYKQAYNYALITNELNNNLEDSWIIFAKALVKLGKKDKAIITLKEYIKYSNSNKAIILLDKIVSGKFK